MRYLALACDYDGTIATHGIVDDATLSALERVKESGRRLILVTGRHLPDLISTFSRTDLFDRVVAENGALLYTPSAREEKTLGDPPPASFVEELERRGVVPSLGRVIVATWQPHETTVLDVIRDLGLELQVIFNKGAVMVLPSGVNKATGLTAALKSMELSAHNVVGVGDAENDHAFLNLCECSAAVENALPVLKERADLVTSRSHGAGVVELIERLITSDLEELNDKLSRHHLQLGRREQGEEFRIPPYGLNVLIAGTSGGGKSTLATGFLERLCDAGYQFCIIDPEGDYQSLEISVPIGDSRTPPAVKEVLELLKRSDQNAAVNLLGLPLHDRPSFFEKLLPMLQEARARTGRPHWIVVDETHHLIPTAWEVGNLTLPRSLSGMLMITVHPEQVSPKALAFVDLIISIGTTPAHTIADFAKILGLPAPPVSATQLKSGEGIAWWPKKGIDPFWFRSIPPRAEHRRHIRKYAEGDLGDERSFPFIGPKKKLKLRAQNLMIFLQIADGVDDKTWKHHLQNGDYSRWFRDMIKDEELAAEAAQIEGFKGLSPDESRARIRAAIERRYTAPA